MALTPEELTQWAQDKINADRLTWTEQNDISHMRGIDHKFDYQLQALVDQYHVKWQAIVARYKELLDIIQGAVVITDLSAIDIQGEFRALKDKVLRIADKYWAVKWEIEGRTLGIFDRTPVGTLYYIDLDNGLDTNDGLSKDYPFLTIEKYTTVESRSAGDIAYVRANTSETGTQVINFDESGTKDSYISIIGCDSVTNDPWSDSSDVKPYLDLSGGDYYMYHAADHFWYLDRLNVKPGSSQGWYVRYAYGNYAKSCEFKNGADRGVAANLGGFTIFDGCNFESNVGESIESTGGSGGLIKNSTFNGSGTHGLYLRYSGLWYVLDSSFGQSSAHSAYDLYCNYAHSKIYMRNVKYNSVDVSSSVEMPDIIYSEDNNQVYGAGKVYQGSGNITKQASPITGDAVESYKMEVESLCGLYYPLILMGHSFDIDIFDSPFVVNGTASQQITITVKMQAESAWTTYPTASELYLEASYYDSGSDAGRSTIASTQTISTSGTWTSFTVTCTPLRNGPIYCNVYLKLYESGKSITVNGEATTS